MKRSFKRPNLILYLFLGVILKIFAFIKGQRISKKVEIKGPAIVLSNHTSFYDFIYTATAAYPHRINYLAADKMFYDPTLSFFLKLARAIPKCLFQSDLKSIRATFTIIKQNGIVGIFPEGQISGIGKTNESPYAIAKLLKKVAVDVYVIKHHNVYFVNPPWTKKSFPGKFETTMEKILTKELIDKMSDEEIFHLVNHQLDYNATEYNQIRKSKFRLNDISNLENIIYRCPACHHEGLISKKTHLHCEKCQLDLTYDIYGRLNEWGLYDLYHQQELTIQDEIKKQEDFSYCSPVQLESYRDNQLQLVGNGTLTLNKQHYIYQGTIDGMMGTKVFNTKNTPYLPSDIGKNIQIYENYQIYQFVFEEKWYPTKIVIAGEYIYRLQN